MIELAVIVALIVAARRLRRSARETRSIRIDIYHHFHFPDGPGEREPGVFFEEPAPENVIPFRHRA